jgi:hypothetical protein
MPDVSATDDSGTPGPVPVAALLYSRPGEPHDAFLFLMKLVVGLAGVMALLDLFRAASSFWIQLSPTPFRGVGTGWNHGSWQAAVGLTSEAAIGVSAALVIAGAVQFLRRRAGARRLLLWGAVGLVGASVASLALSLMQYSILQSAGNDPRSAVILVGWRVRLVLGQMMPALLLLLTLPRPEVRRWLADVPSPGTLGEG